jgi:hypothetical protein
MLYDETSLGVILIVVSSFSGFLRTGEWIVSGNAKRFICQARRSDLISTSPFLGVLSLYNLYNSSQYFKEHLLVVPIPCRHIDLALDPNSSNSIVPITSLISVFYIYLQQFN